MQKYTFCKNWTKIMDPRWFGPRIYPRALSLGRWPLSFRIKILKYIFSLVFIKKFHANQTKGSKDNWGQTCYRQTTDRQTDIFELTPIHRENFLIFFFFFFLRMGGKEQAGWNLYLLTRYASLLRSLAPLAGG